MHLCLERDNLGIVWVQWLHDPTTTQGPVPHRSISVPHGSQYLMGPSTSWVPVLHRSQYLTGLSTMGQMNFKMTRASYSLRT